MWRCVLLEWSMFHAALKFGKIGICKVLEYLAKNLRCSLCFSWIRPISRSNVLPLKCEYRFVLVHHHATVVRCCCCCYCVFFFVTSQNWIRYLRRWIISFETINHLNLTIAPFYSFFLFFILPHIAVCPSIFLIHSLSHSIFQQ